jgi:hypothetical protein
MVDYLNEKNRRDLGIVWLIAGLLFLFNGFSGGTVLLFLGAVWLMTSNEKGIILFQDNPENMRTLLHRVTIGLLVLTSIVLIVNIIR